MESSASYGQLALAPLMDVPAAPSPLSGAYLLIVVGEPHNADHRHVILNRIAKGFLSWNQEECHVQLEKELQMLVNQAPEGEEARNGERLIQFASENLVTEVLIHPQINTLMQCVRNLLASFTRHRHLVHAGYTFAGTGSWILQDGTFSVSDLLDTFQEADVQRVLRAYQNGVSVDVHCSREGNWNTEYLSADPTTKGCQIRVNPGDQLESGSEQVAAFLNYLGPFLVPQSVESLLEPSDVVGNIRFSHPTLYVFPGGQGDAALFGINGFNMLVDGGFARKSCFWDFVRHLDRLDAVLMTRLNNGNISGLASLLRRKKLNHVYPQIGHFFCNLQEKGSPISPDGDKDTDPLLINLAVETDSIVSNLRALQLKPDKCYRSSNKAEPVNLYHKVGHGKLDMYILSPSRDSKEVKEFISKWNMNDQKLFTGPSGNEFTFPLQNLISISALLIWQPANPNDTITRILFPGSTPQHKIFEGLETLRHIEFIKHPVCTACTISPSSSSIGLSNRTTAMKHRPQSQAIDKIAPSDINKETNKVENKIPKTMSIPSTVSKAIPLKEESSNQNLIKQTKKIQKLDVKKTEKSQEKSKIEKKIDIKPKTEVPKKKPDIPKQKVKDIKPIQKTIDKKIEIKSSPTTPKKVSTLTKNDKLGSKTKDSLKIGKSSPTSTPAKSTKDATNRKVVESKMTRSAKYSPPQGKKLPTKKDNNERKTVASRKFKIDSPLKADTASPFKSTTIQGPPKMPSIKSEKEIIDSKIKHDIDKITDSSAVSTPSTVDPETLLKGKEEKAVEESKEESSDKETSLKIEDIESKEEDDDDNLNAIETEKVVLNEKPTEKDKFSLTKGESEEKEEDEYLIIEKEETEEDNELDESTHHSLESYIHPEEVDDIEENEIKKHRDETESEKKKIDKPLNEDYVYEKDDDDDKENKELFQENDTLFKKDNQELNKVIDTKEEKVEDIPSLEKKLIESEEKKTEESATPEDKIDSLEKKESTDDREISQDQKLEEPKTGSKEAMDQKNQQEESHLEEKFSTTVESAATTAPTLPEDERIPLDEIKEIVEEKYVKEETKEKDKPEEQIPVLAKVEQPTTLPQVVLPGGIFSPHIVNQRDIVKTPDEVADLPVHEEVDPGLYRTDDDERDLKKEISLEKSEPQKLEEKIKLEKTENKDKLEDEIKTKTELDLYEKEKKEDDQDECLDKDKNEIMKDKLNEKITKEKVELDLKEKTEKEQDFDKDLMLNKEVKEELIKEKIEQKEELTEKANEEKVELDEKTEYREELEKEKAQTSEDVCEKDIENKKDENNEKEKDKELTNQEDYKKDVKDDEKKNIEEIKIETKDENDLKKSIPDKEIKSDTFLKDEIRKEDEFLDNGSSEIKLQIDEKLDSIHRKEQESDDKEKVELDESSILPKIQSTTVEKSIDDKEVHKPDEFEKYEVNKESLSTEKDINKFSPEKTIDSVNEDEINTNLKADIEKKSHEEDKEKASQKLTEIKDEIIDGKEVKELAGNEILEDLKQKEDEDGVEQPKDIKKITGKEKPVSLDSAQNIIEKFEFEESIDPKKEIAIDIQSKELDQKDFQEIHTVDKIIEKSDIPLLSTFKPENEKVEEMKKEEIFLNEFEIKSIHSEMKELQEKEDIIFKSEKSTESSKELEIEENEDDLLLDKITEKEKLIEISDKNIDEKVNLEYEYGKSAQLKEEKENILQGKDIKEIFYEDLDKDIDEKEKTEKPILEKTININLMKDNESITKDDKDSAEVEQDKEVDINVKELAKEVVDKVEEDAKKIVEEHSVIKDLTDVLISKPPTQESAKITDVKQVEEKQDEDVIISSTIADSNIPKEKIEFDDLKDLKTQKLTAIEKENEKIDIIKSAKESVNQQTLQENKEIISQNIDVKFEENIIVESTEKEKLSKFSEKINTQDEETKIIEDHDKELISEKEKDFEKEVSKTIEDHGKEVITEKEKAFEKEVSKTIEDHGKEVITEKEKAFEKEVSKTIEDHGKEVIAEKEKDFEKEVSKTIEDHGKEVVAEKEKDFEKEVSKTIEDHDKKLISEKEKDFEKEVSKTIEDHGKEVIAEKEKDVSKTIEDHDKEVIVEKEKEVLKTIDDHDKEIIVEKEKEVLKTIDDHDKEVIVEKEKEVSKTIGDHDKEVIVEKEKDFEKEVSKTIEDHDKELISEKEKDFEKEEYCKMYNYQEPRPEDEIHFTDLTYSEQEYIETATTIFPKETRIINIHEKLTESQVHEIPPLKETHISNKENERGETNENVLSRPELGEEPVFGNLAPDHPEVVTVSPDSDPNTPRHSSSEIIPTHEQTETGQKEIIIDAIKSTIGTLKENVDIIPKLDQEINKTTVLSIDDKQIDFNQSVEQIDEYSKIKTEDEITGEKTEKSISHSDKDIKLEKESDEIIEKIDSTSFKELKQEPMFSDVKEFEFKTSQGMDIFKEHRASEDSDIDDDKILKQGGEIKIFTKESSKRDIETRDRYFDDSKDFDASPSTSVKIKDQILYTIDKTMESKKSEEEIVKELGRTNGDVHSSDYEGSGEEDEDEDDEIRVTQRIPLLVNDKFGDSKEKESVAVEPSSIEIAWSNSTEPKNLPKDQEREHEFDFKSKKFETKTPESSDREDDKIREVLSGAKEFEKYEIEEKLEESTSGIEDIDDLAPKVWQEFAQEGKVWEDDVKSDALTKAYESSDIDDVKDPYTREMLSSTYEQEKHLFKESDSNIMTQSVIFDGKSEEMTRGSYNFYDDTDRILDEGSLTPSSDEHHSGISSGQLSRVARNLADSEPEEPVSSGSISSQIHMSSYMPGSPIASKEEKTSLSKHSEATEESGKHYLPTECAGSSTESIKDQKYISDDIKDTKNELENKITKPESKDKIEICDIKSETSDIKDIINLTSNISSITSSIETEMKSIDSKMSKETKEIENISGNISKTISDIATEVKIINDFKEITSKHQAKDDKEPIDTSLELTKYSHEMAEPITESIEIKSHKILKDNEENLQDNLPMEFSKEISHKTKSENISINDIDPKLDTLKSDNYDSASILKENILKVDTHDKNVSESKDPVEKDISKIIESTSLSSSNQKTAKISDFVDSVEDKTHCLSKPEETIESDKDAKEQISDLTKSILSDKTCEKDEVSENIDKTELIGQKITEISDLSSFSHTIADPMESSQIFSTLELDKKKSSTSCEESSSFATSEIKSDINKSETSSKDKECDKPTNSMDPKWDKPLGLPSPPPLPSISGSSFLNWDRPLPLPSPGLPPSDTAVKPTPKKEKIGKKTLMMNENNRKDSKRRESKGVAPIYLELSYVPHHGNSYYSNVEFFKRIRARYYVFSGTEPSREVYNALLEAKQTWEDPSLEVTIIPTYDTDTLGYWVAENEELLAKLKIDLSPSASRCTINLQDHETSCSAYRLEF